MKAQGYARVSVPWSFYVEVARRCNEPSGSNATCVNVNVDKINLAVVDQEGRVLNYKTFRFREVTAHGYPVGGRGVL